MLIFLLPGLDFLSANITVITETQVTNDAIVIGVIYGFPS